MCMSYLFPYYHQQEHSLKGTGMFKGIDKFATSFDAVEEELKSSTVGLVTLEEMKERRENLVKEREKQIASMMSGKRFVAYIYVAIPATFLVILTYQKT